MSVATVSVPAPAAPGGPLTGTGVLVRFNLRRDRIALPAWVVGIAAFVLTGPYLYGNLYPTAQDRANQAAVVGANPAMKALTGPGFGVEDYTYGAMLANEYLGFALILVALMTTVTVVRHTRAEEETGRFELVRASAVGRYAHLAAALLTAALASLALGVIVAVGLGTSGVDSLDWPGSLLFGATFPVTGLVFAGVAAVTAQISAYGRAATGLAGAAIGVAYTVRALGDVADNGLSWLSPVGWMQQTRVYVDDRWWPLLLGVVAAVAWLTIAFILVDRRDVGAGLAAPRRGAETGSARLGTAVGFAWRLHRATVVWWSVAIVLLAASYGSVADVIGSYADNESLRQMMASIGGATFVESYLSFICAILALAAAIFAIAAVRRARAEETAGRAEPVLATALSRTRWLAGHVVVALAGGVLLLALGGLGLGLASAATTGESRWIADLLAAQLAYAPALWATTAVAVAAFGLRPRVLWLAWAVLVWSLVAMYLGALLQLPQWLLNLSAYQHIPRLPVAEFTAWPLVVLTLVAAGLVTAGFASFRRRDLDLG
jgi:ABC-2 type transport system permease protein